MPNTQDNLVDETAKICRINTPRLNTAKMVKLYFGGTPEADIARALNVSKQAVNQALKPYKSLIKDAGSLQAFEENRDKILTAGQAKLLSVALDPKVIKKSSTLQLVSSYGILFDKQRLIRGEATSNVNIKSLIQHNQAQLSGAKDALSQVLSMLQSSSQEIDSDK
jgi:hypothetical protein